MNPAVWLRVERFLGARLMEQHFVVVLTRHEAGGWRAHSPDFPRCHAEGQTAETAVADAARKIRSFIFALRANGKPVPPLRSYAEVRIDDVWARDHGIAWPHAVIKLVQVDNGEVVLDLRSDGNIRSFPAPAIWDQSRDQGPPPPHPKPASAA